ncbi:hypothetical protein DFQ27_009525, partial [Actinomortierella ambigua]
MTTTLPSISGVYWVDVEAVFYNDIKHAFLYSSDINDGLQVLQARMVSRLVNKDNVVPYNKIVLVLDGNPCLEKSATTRSRDEAADQAFTEASKHLQGIRTRVTAGQPWPGRNAEKLFNIALAKSYRMTNAQRVQLAQFLNGLNVGWVAFQAPCEADTAIARRCARADVVVSTDSDLLGYANVTQLVRPMRGETYGIYVMADIIAALGLPSFCHWQALCTVSKTDYSENIAGLGHVRNLETIKNLTGTTTSRVVQQYLALPFVSQKNTTNLTFVHPLNIFEQMNPTMIPFTGTVASMGRQVRQLADDLKALKRQHRAQRPAQGGGANVIGHLSGHQGPSRYRSVTPPGAAKRWNLSAPTNSIKESFSDGDDVSTTAGVRNKHDHTHSDARAEAGNGYIPQTDDTVVQYFSQAAQRGNNDAQLFLAWLYNNGGGGVDKNVKSSLRWCHKAAGCGNIAAQLMLGKMYEQGQDVEASEVEAANWYRTAAVHGVVEAQVKMGEMYENGRGVQQDDAEAFRWFHMAAKDGQVDAQVKAATWFSLGRGVEQSDVEAAKWFAKAAVQGDSEAQFNLGVMYRQGQGVDQSDVEAAK